jgi:hypothetical protein
MAADGNAIELRRGLSVQKEEAWGATLQRSAASGMTVLVSNHGPYLNPTIGSRGSSACMAEGGWGGCRGMAMLAAKHSQMGVPGCDPKHSPTCSASGWGR